MRFLLVGSVFLPNESMPLIECFVNILQLGYRFCNFRNIVRPKCISAANLRCGKANMVFQHNRFACIYFTYFRELSGSLTCHFQMIFFIRDIHRKIRRGKQFFIMCVGLNQPTGNTAFKNCSKCKALKNRNIRYIVSYKAGAACIQNTVQNRYSCRNIRQPQNVTGLGKPAFIKHDSDSKQSADDLPANHNHVSDPIGIILIGKYGSVFRKSKNKLMEIICQHKQCKDKRKYCCRNQPF